VRRKQTAGEKEHSEEVLMSYAPQAADFTFPFVSCTVQNGGYAWAYVARSAWRRVTIRHSMAQASLLRSPS
jgi:hypothetical protein